MINFTHYYCKEDKDPKLFVSLDWFKFEDDFKRLYSVLGEPDHTPEIMKQKHAQNENRHRWFALYFNLFGYRLQLEIRLAKVGLMFYGKYRDAHGDAKDRREMIDRRRARRKTNVQSTEQSE